MSLDGVASRIEKYLSRTNARPEDLFALIDRVNREADEAFRAKVRSAPTAALSAVPVEQRKGVLKQRLQEAADAGKIKPPVPGAQPKKGSWKLDGHRIRFIWVLPDGTEQEGSFSE